MKKSICFFACYCVLHNSSSAAWILFLRIDTCSHLAFLGTYWSQIFGRPYFVRSRLCHSVSSVCRHHLPSSVVCDVLYCGLYGRQTTDVCTYQRVFGDGRFNGTMQNVGPTLVAMATKFGLKSAITRLVLHIDRRCLHLPEGFRGWLIQWNHAKCCGANACCHGNEIWAKIAYKSVCMADSRQMFAPTRGFSGMADSMELCKMLRGRPCCHGNDIWHNCSFCIDRLLWAVRSAIPATVGLVVIAT